jgi:hypothetical protein
LRFGNLLRGGVGYACAACADSSSTLAAAVAAAATAGIAVTRKLGLETRAELALFALAHGLIGPS